MLDGVGRKFLNPSVFVSSCASNGTPSLLARRSPNP